MKSLEKQLQLGLGLLLLIVLVGQLLITKLSTHKILGDVVNSHLEQDAERIFNSLVFMPPVDGSIKERVKIRWRRLDPVYNTPDSGYYYSLKLHLNNQEEIINSPSLQDDSLPFDKRKQSVFLYDFPILKDQYLIIWTQKFQKNGYNIIISVAENVNQLVEQRKKSILVYVGLGIIGFLLLFTLQRYIVRRLFKHLNNSRQEIKEVAEGSRQSLSEQVPSEIYPLVKEFNHTLSLMQQRLERSRNSLGNLAHALKTPLSILMQALDDDSLASKSKTKQVKLQAERIQELMKRELKRANMAGLGNTSQRFNPHEELPVLADVLKLAHKRDHLQITINIAMDISAFGDREDMLELFGNLLDNACKWAKSQVLCRITTDDKKQDTVIYIEDDGSSHEESELKKLAQRGTRLDENIEGYGLGLAICKDIIKLYNGTLTFKQSSKLSGLLVIIHLPKGISK